MSGVRDPVCLGGVGDLERGGERGCACRGVARPRVWVCETARVWGARPRVWRVCARPHRVWGCEAARVCFLPFVFIEFWILQFLHDMTHDSNGKL